MVSHFFDEVNHHLWLQGPLNHLTKEQTTSYITGVLRRILEFLHV
jgi:hypothetical protein